jgi:ABC-type sugar transport system ATPase subunit
MRLRRETVAYIFQSFGLLPVLSAAENVGVPLRIAGMAPPAGDGHPGPSARYAQPCPAFHYIRPRGFNR